MNNILPLTAEELNNKTNYLFADEEDICYKINDTYCVCSLSNDCNNIGIESQEYKISTTRDMLRFLKILYEEYNIDYISIREHVKWDMLKRVKHFTNENGVHFIKISDNLNIFTREIPND